MLIDAAQLPDGSSIESSIAIIGGGMAGLTMASELARAGKSVCILESGSQRPESADGRRLHLKTQDLLKGTASLAAPDAEREIDEYLVSSRLRAIGGAGNLWGGKCAPLDPMDFADRSWIPNSGWPFNRRDLASYYDRACDVLKMPHFDFDLAMPREPDRPPLTVNGNTNFTTVSRQHTNVTGAADTSDFAAFRDAVLEHAQVRVYANANVTNIALNLEGTAVERVEVACLNGKRHVATARQYLLATGGIENARLLLSSNGVHTGGIGNQHDLVGRFFSGHVTYGDWKGTEGANTAVFFSRLNQSFDLYASRDRSKVWGILATSSDAQRREQLPNFTVTFFPLNFEPPGVSQTIASLARCSDDPDWTGTGSARAVVDGHYFPAYFMCEQLSHPESRVTLTSERDELGMRRVNLRWRFDKTDFDGLERSIRFLRKDLGSDSSGRVEWPVERSRLLEIMRTSRHHIGTTRMHANPRFGVVDTQCRVHGVANLYVAGSSVFPTGGIANPTLTILALAIRLTDHFQTLEG